MNEVAKIITETGVVPVIKLENPTKHAAPLAKALCAGGVPIAEVTFRAAGAPLAIKLMRETCPDMLVGAGTVLDSETARIAIDAGAKFIIAPTFSKDVAKLCNRYQIPYCPGCTTCNEMVEAMEYGASFIKCFPISNFYGPDLVKIFKTPLPQMPVMVSGGVSMDNIDAWLKNGADCLAMGGLLTKGGKDDIAASAKKVMERVHGGK
ncbi:MAG: bifunctional 4-hydroxy-2-oxoglutarate aldolase/2-dehydro-3-deoxy-phosphogluconate aldolase [Clostridia bacterium]|nr:bifunctional 4-hydroxy-2-oxoglutarate aldolase/2-dehydro-3-deoxy-phosphogluconate aldolase [Clostridia bacterium]